MNISNPIILSFYRFLNGSGGLPKAHSAIIPFLLLSLLLFCNLNGVIQTITGIGALGSPLILICCAWILICVPIKASDLNWPITLFLFFLISFLLVGWISAAIHNDHFQVARSGVLSSSREIITALIILVSMFVFMQWYIKKVSLDSLIYIILFFFFITLLAGAFEGALGLRNTLFIDKGDNERALGFFGNPNETGLQANLTMILVILLYLRNRISLIVFVGLLGLCAYGAISSFSKTAMVTFAILWITLIGYFIMNIFVKNRQRRFKSVAFMSLFSIALAILVQVFLLDYLKTLTPSQIGRIEETFELVFSGELNADNTSNRSEIVFDAMDIIGKSPWIGYGSHTFARGGFFPKSPTHGVHNFYLRVGGEAGLPILFLFLFTIVFTMIYSMRHCNRDISYFILCSIGCVILYNLASHNTIGKKFLVGYLAFSFALINLKLKSKPQSAKQLKILTNEV